MKEIETASEEDGSVFPYMVLNYIVKMGPHEPIGVFGFIIKSKLSKRQAIEMMHNEGKYTKEVY
jgi:hypothetical protein